VNAYELQPCWQPITTIGDKDVAARCISKRWLYNMLKITRHISTGSRHLTVEGRLIGPWVNELEQAWNGIRQSEGGPLVVDLTGITFIEDNGKQLLSRMWREGAELIATGCCNRPIVEQITGARPSSPANQRSRK
jgi:hypothetical protein